jgi:hypothetical protein
MNIDWLRNNTSVIGKSCSCLVIAFFLVSFPIFLFLFLISHLFSPLPCPPPFPVYGLLPSSFFARTDTSVLGGSSRWKTNNSMIETSRLMCGLIAVCGAPNCSGYDRVLV